MLTQQHHLIFERFLGHANSHPESIAAEYGDLTITYSELAEQACSIGRQLKELSFPAGSPVLVRLERSPELLAAMLGIWQAGLTYLPADPCDPECRVREIARSAHCKAVISLPTHSNAASNAASSSTPKKEGRVLLITKIDAEGAHDLFDTLALDPGYVIYTSGSTGTPKGVVVAQSVLAELIDELIRRYEITPCDRVLQFAAPSFDTSIEQICVTLAAGATLVMPDRLWAPSEFQDQISQRRITVMDLTPSYWREVATVNQGSRLREFQVRLVIFGGSAVYNQDLRKARDFYPEACIINAYGLTETVITSCLAVVDPNDPLRDGPAAVGYPLATVNVAVLDDTGNPRPHCETGEVAISGRLASAIIGAASIDGVPDVFLTGDLGHLDPTGRLTVTGRKDRQIKVRGFRVNPSEIELSMQCHESILDAAVVNAPANVGLVAFYTVLPGDADPGVIDLLDYLRSRLPSYAIPRKIIAVSTLPQTRHGKVDYRALAELATASTNTARTKKTEAAVAETPLYAAVAELWRSVLKLEVSEWNQNFFDCGGTSITAAELVARTRSSLGIHVRYVRPLLGRLLVNPTLKGYCSAVEEARTGRLNFSGDQLAMQHADLARTIAVDPTAFRANLPTSDPRRILLTGATGFLGAHLLPRLLAQTNANITCLVRAESEEHGIRRLQEARENYGSGGDPFSGGRDRIDVLVGDLAQPELGLTTATFDLLAEETDLVIHSGGTVNFIYPYTEMKAANVDGTIELLRLSARRGAAFHYVSTMAVIAGQGVAGITMVNEDDPLDHLHELGVGYVESKWVSEYLVRKAGQAGLPVAIYRAADISGHSVTGTWNTKTEMCCMKKFILDIGAFPNAELPMDYTPVDVFADVLIHIVLNEKLTGRTYHVTNPNKAHISLLADRLRARGHQIKQVSWEDWVSQMVNLAVQSPEHPMTPFAPLFIDRCPSGRMSVAQMYLEDTFPRFSRDNVDLALNGTGIVFPEVNAELVDRYLDFLQSRAFI